ncbi:DUF4838 domain-containing protein [Faecalibaculum rodentium]|uniref:DUF4838 domain-containing protein n=1 Tax=Faecalibaculum rodentium TaxID=1702221 RepID=UPI002493D85A|nr:DUF4838 domain-containing protein [Faecalibaculum rodentium]
MITYKIDDNVTNKAFLKTQIEYYLPAVFGEEVQETEDGKLSFVMEELPGYDGIRIETRGTEGTVASNSSIGLLNAFYRWLTELVARFLRPGIKNEILPSLNPETFSREVQISLSNAKKHRGVCIEGADSLENVLDFVDWLPKIGFNSFFIQFENPYSFFKRWYEHEFNPYKDKEPFSTELAQQMSDEVDRNMLARGLKHHRVGHGWTGEVLGYSSKYGWESGLTIPEEKKEFVAELGGQRELFRTAPILTSLDFANPKVTAMMSDIIVDYAKDHPEVDYLHVWLSDAPNNICECEECRKERVSDQYVRILNALDKRLTEEGIETKICFLLYHELLWAPLKEVIENSDRYTLMFAPISRTFEKSYADVDYEALPETRPYVRNQVTLPNSLEENLACLFDWQKNFQGDSFVYDYPLGRAHYGDFGYMKISRTIYRDTHFLYRLHLNGYISCQELRAGFPHNFPNYVMGRSLFEPEKSYEELTEEYFSGLYGENWKEVVSYLELLSANTSCDHFNAIGSRENTGLAGNYQICVNAADNFAPVIKNGIIHNAGLVKEQYIQLAWHREYVKKLGLAMQAIAEGDRRYAQILWEDFLDFIRRGEDEIQPNLDVYRVIEVAKNYAGFTLND